MKLDRHTLPLKLLFAAVIGANGLLHPYLSLFFASFDLSGAQIAVLNAITPIVSTLVIPLVSTYADRFGSHRHTLLSCLSLTIFCNWLLSKSSSFTELFVSTLLVVASSASILSLCDISAIELLEHSQSHDRSMYGYQRVWGSASYAVTSLIGSHLMSSTSANSGASNNASSYNFSLVFPLGIAMLVAAMGVMFIYPSIGTHPSLRSRFNLALQVPQSQSTPSIASAPTSTPPTSESTSIASLTHRSIVTARAISQTAPLPMFFAVAFMSGLGVSSLHTFSVLQLHLLSAPPLWIGVSRVLMSLSEVPFLLLSSSARNLPIFSLAVWMMAVYAARFFAFTWQSVPVIALSGPRFFSCIFCAGANFQPFDHAGISCTLAELLHGFCYALVWPTLTLYLHSFSGAVARVLPPSAPTSASSESSPLAAIGPASVTAFLVGSLSVLHWSIAGTLSALLGGGLIDAFGGSVGTPSPSASQALTVYWLMLGFVMTAGVILLTVLLVRQPALAITTGYQTSLANATFSNFSSTADSNALGWKLARPFLRGNASHMTYTRVDTYLDDMDEELTL